MSSSPLDVTSVAHAFGRQGHHLPTSSLARRRARLRLTASVLALGLAALTAPAFAQQTGGNGGNSGGTGGQTNPTDGTGTAGANSGSNGGGGGGAGIVGGNGGDSTGAGGTGGTAAGADGLAGTSGGGGGGGAHGETTLLLGSAVTGGRGGSGGTGVVGGGGGGGGYGVFVTDTAFVGSLTHIVTGGDGGSGGSGNNGGNGGAGGVGVFFSGSATLTNLSVIRGGSGGAGGTGGISSGSAGAGGAGVVGANLIIDNTRGYIEGGSGANAITFTGGNNELTLRGTGNLTGNIGIAAGASVAFNQSSDVSLFNVITGGGNVDVAGSGVLTLSGSNTYSGITTLAASTLRAGAVNTFSAASSIAMWSGAVLDLNGYDQTIAGLAGLPGETTTDVRLGSATLTTGGTGDSEYSGTISGTGGLTKAGTGLFTLSGSNTYTGATTVNGGTLYLNGGTAIADTSAVVVNAAGMLSVNASETIGSLAGSGGVWLSGGQRLTVGGDNTSTTFSGTIEETIGGTVMLGKIGTGTLTLSGANSYTGTTTISAGALNIQNATALGTTAGGTTVAAGAALQMQGGITVTGEELTLNGAGVNNDGALRNVSGNNYYQGAITLGSASRINSDSGNLVLPSGITGANTDLIFGGAGRVIAMDASLGTGSLTMDGTGLLQLYGTNLYSGATTINGGGEIDANSGSAIDDRSAVTISSGKLSITISETIGSLAGAGAGAVSIGTSQRLTVGTNDASTTFSGVINGSGTFTKVGTGTLTLTGASTYTGATTVSAGNLRVNGSLVSAVTVATGATLSGTGTISNEVIVRGGSTLSAGQSPGTLTVSSLTLDAGSTSVFELGTAGTVGGTTNDLVNVTGNLNLGGTLEVNAPSAGYYRLFNYDTLTPASAFSSVTGSTQGTATVLTNIAGQVNLSIIGAGQQLQFWDGSDATGNGIVNGGGGVWSAASTNWTGAPGEAGINDQWRRSVGVFAGATSGGVTVDAAQAFDTLQFSTSGYILLAGTDGELQLAGASNTGTINTDGGVAAAISLPIVDGTATNLNKVGAGTLILAGANTYTGTTTVSEGVLNIRSASALGTAAGGTTVSSGAALQMQGGVTVTGEALTLNGTGVNNDGALRNFAGVNTFAGPITLGTDSRINADAGTLNLQTISGANRALIFGGAGGVIVSGVIGGGVAGLTKDGTGVLGLTGGNTYTGTTTINDGTLQVGNGAAIIDTGAVVVNAPGIFEVINSETIGSLAGAGAVNIRNGQTLTIGGADTSTTFSGAITQTGAPGGLTKIGTGTFTLTGNNTYTGATTVDGGTLSVNGSIATSSMTMVNASGTLSGTGFVGNTTINGGMLAPGNSIGTLTVQGNLVMTSASTYMVEVSPASADRVNITGTASLGGATVQASFATGSYVEKQYTIVNATGGFGGSKFGSQVNTNLPSNFKSGLSYDANNAYLNLTLDFTPTPSPTPGPNGPSYGSLPGNQGNVARALENFFTRTGGIPLVFGALDAKGLSQVSGELAPGSQQTSFDVMNLFMMQMIDPFAAGRGEATPGVLPYADEAMAYAGKRAPSDAFASMTRKAPPMAPAFQERWNVWASGFGGSQTTDGNTTAGTNNSKSSIYGMAVGADYWLSPFTVAGISMAGGGTNFSVNGGGSGRSDLFQFGGFVRHTMGSVYVSTAAAYGWQDITTDRTVTLAGLDQLRSKFNANSYSGRIEVGNRFVLPSIEPWIGGLGLTPYGAAQVTAFDLPSYAESVVAGANTFALAYSGKTITATRTELGLRSDKSFALNDAILTLRGRAAWAHDFNTERSASATFQTLPGASFVVSGAALARNAALTTASAELKWMNGWSIAGTFEGEFSDVTKSYAGKGVVRYAW